MERLLFRFLHLRIGVAEQVASTCKLYCCWWARQPELKMVRTNATRTALIFLSLLVRSSQGFQTSSNLGLTIKTTTHLPIKSKLTSSTTRQARKAHRYKSNARHKYSATVVDDESIHTNSNFLSVLWRFSRPHTIIGSALAIPSIHFLAAPTLSAVFSKSALSSILYALVPSLLMNLYITGLNQITDVDIDKVNKPSLPIAAGDLSMSNAKIIVSLSIITSLMIGLAHPILGSQGLNVALWGSAILGTAYSLEPLRLKRFPVLAAFCIVAIRGAIINAGFYAHAMTAAFGKHATVLGCLMNDKKCAMSSLFFAIFGIVIALMKDVPDAIGDAQFNIKSFTVRMGQKNVFLAMRRLITVSFFGVGAAFVRGASVAYQSGIGGEIALCRSLVALAAFGAGISSRHQAQSVNPEDSPQVYGYYMHLWKLFYLSYLFLPFAR